MLAEFLGIERRATQGPTYTAADYERLVLSGDSISFATSAESALSTAAVWQAINLLSGDLAKLPLEKLRIDADDREVKHPAHPSWSVVHDRPTPNMGAFKWWARFYVQLLLWSNAYARINRNGLGDVESLTLIESDSVVHQLDEDGDAGYWYTDSSGTFAFLRADETLHVEDMALHKSTSSGSVTEKPLQALVQARAHVNLNKMIEKYGTLFFERGGRLGGWLELPPQMTKKAKDKYETAYREAYETSEAMFKINIFRGQGLKFTPASQANPEETQMVEARKEQVRDTARWWNIPPHKLGDHAKTSYNSLEQENKSYLDSTLSPRLAAVVDECKCKLLRPMERSSGRHLYRHDVSALVQVDTATAYEVAVKGYTNGLTMQNEGRRLLGLQPVDGGDEFMTPMNMTVGPAAPADSSPSAAEPADADPADEDELRFVRIPLVDALQRALESMDRAAARKAKQMTPTGFANWLTNQLETANRKQVEAKLKSAVSAYAGAAGIDEPELFSRLFRCLCGEIRQKAQKNTKISAEASSLLMIERVENGQSLGV